MTVGELAVLIWNTPWYVVVLCYLAGVVIFGLLAGALAAILGR